MSLRKFDVGVTQWSILCHKTSSTISCVVTFVLFQLFDDVLTFSPLLIVVMVAVQNMALTFRTVKPATLSAIKNDGRQCWPVYLGLKTTQQMPAGVMGWL